MAKKKVLEVVQRVKIYSTEFSGYVDEMPQEAKDALALRNKYAKKLFEVKG